MSYVFLWLQIINAFTLSEIMVKIINAFTLSEKISSVFRLLEKAHHPPPLLTHAHTHGPSNPVSGKACSTCYFNLYTIRLLLPVSQTTEFLSCILISISNGTTCTLNQHISNMTAHHHITFLSGKKVSTRDLAWEIHG